MRRPFLPVLALAAALFAAPAVSFAQQDEEGGAKKDEWEDRQAPLPALRNAGPCPFVKVLYDAGRYVEFKDGREAAASVGWTGEIQGVSAGCRYKGAEPVQVEMEILFELGKGPQASGDAHTYRYWVAVTDRNRAVLAKEWFDLPASFKGGERVMMTDKIDSIVIPRATENVSGANFEILVGFEVTPQMAEFNRQGKRFRVNVGAPGTTAAQ